MSKCILKFDGKCRGKIIKLNIFNRGGFSSGLDIPACEEHSEAHKEIVALYHDGHDIDDILNMPADRRKSLLAENIEENNNEISNS